MSAGRPSCSIPIRLVLSAASVWLVLWTVPVVTVSLAAPLEAQPGTVPQGEIPTVASPVAVGPSTFGVRADATARMFVPSTGSGGGPVAVESDPFATARSRGYATLEDCFRAALTRSERMGRAREALVQARLDRKTALAAVLPDLTAEGSYYRQNKVVIAPAPGVGGTTSPSPGITFSDRRREAYVSLQQPIFSGFRDRNVLAAASLTIEALGFGFYDAARVLYGDIAEAFYQTLQLQGDVATFEDSLRVERSRVDEVRARRDVGLARKTEVLLVETQFAEDESRLTHARNDLNVARERLDFLVGYRIDLPIRDEEAPAAPLSSAAPSASGAVGQTENPGHAGTGPGPGAGGQAPSPGSGGQAPGPAGLGQPSGPGGETLGRPAPSADLEEKVQLALARRRDLGRKERELAAAQRNVAVVRGQYYPTVGLEADYILDRQGFSEFSEKADWTAQVNVSLPIFDGGRIRAAVATAESQLRQAQLDRDELARSIRLAVESAWLTSRSDLAQLSSLRARVASAEENDRLVREEYRSGLATNLEVLTAQNQLLSGRLELDRQTYQVSLDLVALEVAQGLRPRGTIASDVPAPESDGKDHR